MKYIKITSKDSEKIQEEIADEDALIIDLIHGFLAPSWQVKNLYMYAPTSSKYDENTAINMYKKELLYFWKNNIVYDTKEKEEEARSVQSILKDAISQNKNIYLATPSGNKTVFSEIFENFLQYAKKNAAE